MSFKLVNSFILKLPGFSTNIFLTPISNKILVVLYNSDSLTATIEYLGMSGNLNFKYDSTPLS